MLRPKTPRKGRFSLFARLFGVLASGALVAGWLAPNHYPPWPSFHGEAAVFLALIGFGLALLADRPFIVWGHGPLLGLALAALVALQWWGGQILYGGDALVSALYVLGFGGAWWIGANVARDARVLEKCLGLFAALVVTGAVLSVFVAVLQWQRLETNLAELAAHRGPGMRPFGNLGQPNHLATLTLMGIAMSGVLRVRQWLNRWQWLTVVAFLSLGLILTESRSGLLGAFVLGLFFLLKGQKTWGLGDRKGVILWWAALLVVVSVWAPLNQALLLEPGRDASVTGLARDNLRATMWKQSIAAIQESPWTGYGWRQTVVAQKTGAGFIEGTLATDYAHNLGLDLLLWLGIPLGGLLIAGSAFWLLRAGWKCEGPLQFLMYAGVIPVGVHSLVEFPFAYAYFLFPVGYLLGALSVAQATERSPRKFAQGSPTWWLSAGLIAAFASVCAVVVHEYLLIEEDYRVMRFELRRVGKRPADHEAPQISLLTQLDETLKVGRMVPYPGMPARDIERLRIASTSQAWATLHLSYAVALGLNGQPEEASRQLRTLRALYGNETYKQVREKFLEAQEGPYPQLAQVRLP
jgi:hypothetical protein